MFAIWNSQIMGVGILVIGFCVGSFLNVAIHRIPNGLSVNNPKRSFCPHCKTTLPWWQNLPIVTWLIQRGKCRTCQAPIAVRYLIVEVLTGLLFYATWRQFDLMSGLLCLLFITILITVSFIDAETQLIPVTWTTAGVLLAFAGSFFRPELINLVGKVPMASGWLSFREAVIGWVAGFGTLLFVVLLGKFLFGRQKLTFKEAVLWKLQEGHGDSEQLHWVLGDESYSWDDLFYRSTDELVITGHGFKVDGQRTPGKEVVIRRDDFVIGEKKWSIDSLKSLTGKATAASIPREAMGMGDPHLLGMIGAFLGWPAVIFVVFVSSIYAILAALVARVGFGKPLPFGPFLALAALTWVFGGWKLWEAYFQFVSGTREVATIFIEPILF